MRALANAKFLQAMPCFRSSVRPSIWEMDGRNELTKQWQLLLFGMPACPPAPARLLLLKLDTAE